MVLKRTFTMIEMLVVMVIIGLILGLVGPALIQQADEAKVSSTYNQMKMLKDVLDTYKLKKNKYPENLQQLVEENLLREKYVPQDGWNNDFIYSVGGENGFELQSYGADGQPGGTDVNADLNAWDNPNEKEK